jgi:ribosomal protein S17E
MGKAIPKYIKMRAKKLLDLAPDGFGVEFVANKQAVSKLGLPISKTERNLIAGYIVRLKKQIAAKEAM